MMATGLTYKGHPCKIIGTSSVSRPCDCCGNTILERVIVLEVDECDIIEIGAVCAAKNIFRNASSSRKVKQLAANADDAARKDRRHELRLVADRMIHSSQTESRDIVDANHKHLALRVYMTTGRKVENRRLWTNGEWAVAVDVGCEIDTKRWTLLGFA